MRRILALVCIASPHNKQNDIFNIKDKGEHRTMSKLDDFLDKVQINSQGQGRNQGDKPGSGPAGSCVCPKCGNTVAHTTGQPCNETSCGKCGTKMTRK
jgi:hypothetical protein